MKYNKGNYHKHQQISCTLVTVQFCSKSGQCPNCENIMKEIGKHLWSTPIFANSESRNALSVSVAFCWCLWCQDSFFQSASFQSHSIKQFFFKPTSAKPERERVFKCISRLSTCTIDECIRTCMLMSLLTAKMLMLRGCRCLVVL